MNKTTFPWVGIGIGLFFMLILINSGATDPAGEHALPLLTMLFLCEFGFIVTAAGAVIGSQAWLNQRGNLKMLMVSLGGVLLALGFAMIGLALWQG